MKFLTHEVSDWPKLAWIAKARRDESAIEVWHGPYVEASERWIIEGVWDGDFDSGSFDRTEGIFGSGIRLRETHADFVSSGTINDRLAWYCAGDTWWISNSLPGLLGVAGLHLRDDYLGYEKDIAQIAWGLDTQVQSIPAREGDIRLTYFHNLRFDGQDLREVEKPDTAPCFDSYETYTGYLADACRRIGDNLVDPARTFRIDQRVSISSGYDSPAVAVLAREAGCEVAVTLAKPNSLWRRSDSGRFLAHRLGYKCNTYPSRWDRCEFEGAVWASTARPGCLNMASLGHPPGLSVHWSGHAGDTVWAREHPPQGRSAIRRGFSGLGVTEFRLWRGFFHVVLPYLGMRREAEIKAISMSPEMLPWSVGGGYDRPIPRRLVEDCGVPRRAFGVDNKNTAAETYFLWPYSRACQQRYADWLGERGIASPSPWQVALLRKICHLDHLLASNVTKRLGFDIGIRRRVLTRANHLMFQWANDELADRYRRALDGSGEQA